MRLQGYWVYFVILCSRADAGSGAVGWMIEHMGDFAAAYGLGAVVYALGFVLNSRGKVVSVQSVRSSL